MPPINLYQAIKFGHVLVTNSSPPQQRFWASLTKDGPIHPVCGQCWQWIGCIAHDGYGVIKVYSVPTKAHRYSWTVNRGVIPPGQKVLHQCDYKSCVNPDHLFLGTIQDNSDDKVAKGRQTKGSESHWAKITEEDVMFILTHYRPRHRLWSAPKLAAMFGLRKQHVYEILWGWHWKHVYELWKQSE